MRNYSRNRKDLNHTEIINGFKTLGFSVLDISNLPNCADLVVTKQGITVIVEVKDGSQVPSKRKLTTGERAFAEMWVKDGHWMLIESLIDVEKLNKQIINQKRVTL